MIKETFRSFSIEIWSRGGNLENASNLYGCAK